MSNSQRSFYEKHPAFRTQIALIKHASTAVFVIIILFFLGRYLHKNWTQINEILQKDALRNAFVLGCCCAFSGYVLRGAVWSLLRYEVTKIPMSIWRGFHITSVSGMGRYIPGKIWSFAGKAYMSSQSRQDISGHVAAVLLDNLLFAESLAVVGGVSFLISHRSYSLLGEYSFIGVIVVASTILAAEPHIFYLLFNAGLRFFKRPPLAYRPRYHIIAAIQAGNIIAISSWAIAFLLLTKILTPLNATDAVFLISFFCFGWLLGLFIFIAPAGVGVRETLLVLGLKQATSLTSPEIITIVVATRLISTFTEIVCAAIALIGDALFPAPPPLPSQEVPADDTR